MKRQIRNSSYPTLQASSPLQIYDLPATKKIEKRSDFGDVQVSKGIPDQYEKEQEDQKSLIYALISTVKHFSGLFNRLFCEVTDPRHPLQITCPLAVLAFSGILMFLCHLKARRQISLLLRNGPSALKFHSIFDVETCPHGDTLNDAFMNLDTQQVEPAVTEMTETLIRQKVLYPYRLLDIHFIVAVDGTGVLVYHECHCSHCLPYA